MKQVICLLIGVCLSATLTAQSFETGKLNGEEFEDITVRIGADFAMQFQGLRHYSDSISLIPLGTGINLPTANLVVEADLAPGIRVNLTTYLSSRHHVEAWVKGGYLLVDELPFIRSSLLDQVMKFITLKIGVMELDFGDAHYRRSDNGRVTNNPFVGNYIMESFTTAPGAELMLRHKGILLMAGLNTGSLKPALAGYNTFSDTYISYNTFDELAFHWKAGYDWNPNDKLRIRASLSGFHNPRHHFGSLYNGDRTGSRYYLVMKPQTGSADDVDPASGHMTGNWGPGFTDKNDALMANLYTRLKGFELFGTLERTKGTSAFGGAEFIFTQYAVEGLYYAGKKDQFFTGARYNKVFNQNDESANRFQVTAGWYLTPNIMAKMEYVNQKYTNFNTYKGADAGFNGLMFEAGISF